MMKRILIVEDEAVTAMFEEHFMRDLGYEVTGIAKSGEEAVDKAGRDRPDLVLMDIQLMGDMDGSEAARIIRKAYQIPVVFITAFGDKRNSTSENLSVPEGFGYVVKPFTKEELQAEIERLIG